MGFIVDAHSDILLDIHPKREVGDTKILENYWVPKMRQGQIDVRVMAIYVDTHNVPELALRRSLDMIDTLYQEVEESHSCVLCTTHEDLVQAKEAGRIGLLLGLEGAEPLGFDVQLLRIFYKLGLRVFGLTHARRNYLADGARYFPYEMGQEGGLTEYGVEFLQEAQRLNMVIDLVHLNAPGFWDAMGFVKGPVIVSHSNSSVVFDHPRNIPDDQVKAVADNGGVVGVNACKGVVGDGELDLLLKHIAHMVKVGGVEHVGLGPDFADYAVEHLSPTDRVRVPIDAIKGLKGLAGDEDIPNIADGLSKMGYAQADVDRIMGDNFMRVFKKVLG